MLEDDHGSPPVAQAPITPSALALGPFIPRCFLTSVDCGFVYVKRPVSSQVRMTSENDHKPHVCPS